MNGESRVVGHAQVVEDQTDIARQTLDGGGDGIAGSGFEDADSKAAESRDVLGAVAGAEGATIFIPVPVEEVVAAIFDGPVTAPEDMERCESERVRRAPQKDEGRAVHRRVAR